MNELLEFVFDSLVKFCDAFTQHLALQRVIGGFLLLLGIVCAFIVIVGVICRAIDGLALCSLAIPGAVCLVSGVLIVKKSRA